jgi:A/G-specific adenine glycosylase
MLLLRTRAENVVPVYQRLVKDFPTVYDLLQMNENSLKGILSPLGLKWRTDMLLMSLRTIVDDFGGEIPTDKQKLLSIPGVGDYIASATRVFSLNLEDPLIDTNTVRVISRVYGVKVTDSSRRSKVIRDKYSELRNTAEPRAFGFSMIDLASLICKSNSPDCHHCTVMKHCSTGRGETKLRDYSQKFVKSY